jgi:hypothetical protein
MPSSVLNQAKTTNVQSDTTALKAIESLGTTSTLGLLLPANSKIYKKCFVQSLSALLKKIDIQGIYTTSFERNEISN